ncbi:hypothetical protein JW877_10125 [bacterium]|nr:hypothetical protein [bacterium]
MKSKVCFVLMVISILSSSIIAQIPKLISYQGYLTDDTEERLPVPDGRYSITFYIFNSAHEGANLWTETQNLDIAKGVYNAYLGSITPLNLPFDEPYWLEIEFNSTVLSPRYQLGTSPYAFIAVYAESSAYSTEASFAENAGRATETVYADSANFAYIASYSDSSYFALDADNASFADSAGATGVAYSINWENILGIPDGFADGIDDVAEESSIYYAGEGIEIVFDTIRVADYGINTEKLQSGAVTGTKINDMGALDGYILKWNSSTNEWYSASDSGGVGFDGNDMVKADIFDPIPGFLSDKVDDLTIGVNTVTHKIQLLEGGIDDDFLNLSSITLADFVNDAHFITLDHLGAHLDDHLFDNDSTNELISRFSWTQSTGQLQITEGGIDWEVIIDDWPIDLSVHQLNELEDVEAITSFEAGPILQWNGSQWVTGTYGSGETNKLAYWTEAGTLTSDPGLHWDNMNLRLGIGTSSPICKVQVAGNVEAEGFTIGGVPLGASTDTYWSAGEGGTIFYNSGKVGIGTSIPNATIAVMGGDTTSWENCAIEGVNISSPRYGGASGVCGEYQGTTSGLGWWPWAVNCGVKGNVAGGGHGFGGSYAAGVAGYINPSSYWSSPQAGVIGFSDYYGAMGALCYFVNDTFYGVYGQKDEYAYYPSFAGYFDGDVLITGELIMEGGIEVRDNDWEYFEGSGLTGTIYHNGPVGIGTSDPYSHFEVLVPYGYFRVGENYGDIVNAHFEGGGTGQAFKATCSSGPTYAYLGHESPEGNFAGYFGGTVYVRDHLGIGIANPEGMLNAISGDMDGGMCYSYSMGDFPLIFPIVHNSVYGKHNAAVGILGQYTYYGPAHMLNSMKGVYGYGVGATRNYGVYGSASGGDYAYGIYGEATGATKNWAGYFSDGLVYIKDKLGIGISNPSARLEINGDGDNLKLSRDGMASWQFGPGFNDGPPSLIIDSEGSEYFRITESGNVGIGVIDPDAKLHVNGSVKINYSNDTRSYTSFSGFSRNASMIIRDTLGVATIKLYSSNGRGIVKELEITGGSDLSEQFEVNSSDILEPGMLVSIDPENSGKLILSNIAYDKKVAGILSGAGEIKTGLLMGQSESVADGQYPVALSGRVYCWATTENGPIEPGDLLTSSTQPGFAMKVTDYNNANGAIIGKAMDSLKNGTRLVLVLVSLQ